MTTKLGTQSAWLNQNSQSRANMQQAHETRSRVTYLKGATLALPDAAISTFLTILALVGKMITLGYSSRMNHFYTQEKHHVATALTTIPIGILGTIHPLIAEKTAPKWLITPEDRSIPRNPPKQKPTQSIWTDDQYAYLLELQQAYRILEMGQSKRDTSPSSPRSAQARGAGQDRLGIYRLYLEE